MRVAAQLDLDAGHGRRGEVGGHHRRRAPVERERGREHARRSGSAAAPRAVPPLPLASARPRTGARARGPSRRGRCAGPACVPPGPRRHSSPWREHTIPAWRSPHPDRVSAGRPVARHGGGGSGATRGNKTRARDVWHRRESHRSRRGTTQAHRPRGGACRFAHAPRRPRRRSARRCSSRATPGSARPRSGARRSPTRRRAATACCAAWPSRPRRGCRSSASPTWPAPIADDFLDALPAPQREALEVALVRRAGSGRPPDPTAVGVGLRSLLVRAAEAGPLVLALDDVQWLDAATARALAFAVRRLDGLPVGVLATVRTPLAEADPLGLERALGAGRLQRERLGPLGIERAARPDRVAARPRVPAPDAAEARPGVRRQPAVRARDRPRARPRAGARGRRAAAGPREPARARRRAASPTSTRRRAARCSSPPRSRTRPSSSSSRRPPPPGWSRRRRAGCSASRATGSCSPTRCTRRRSTRAAASGRRRALHAQLAELVAESEERVRHRALAAAAARRAGRARRSRTPPRRPAARGAWETAGELLEQARALTPAARPYAARARGVRAAEHHIHAGDRPRARALLEAILDRRAARPDAQRRAAAAGRDPLQRGRLRRRARRCSRRRSSTPTTRRWRSRSSSTSATSAATATATSPAPTRPPTARSPTPPAPATAR